MPCRRRKFPLSCCTRKFPLGHHRTQPWELTRPSASPQASPVVASPTNQDRAIVPLDRDRVQRKLWLAAELFRFAYETKRHQLRQRHPTLSERELNHRAYALIERGCTR